MKLLCKKRETSEMLNSFKQMSLGLKGYMLPDLVIEKKQTEEGHYMKIWFAG